ncbi:unnamed protein product [Phytophthora lilii]|uniref:Unnamed protein product n=1 Tax=Phytophthora lilii TaxID=2077276 RepID=A0A9W6U9T7_9STRA|nr:unnamed protein product [Phytophthora lilii]
MLLEGKRSHHGLKTIADSPLWTTFTSIGLNDHKLHDPRIRAMHTRLPNDMGSSGNPIQAKKMSQAPKQPLQQTRDKNASHQENQERDNQSAACFDKGGEAARKTNCCGKTTGARKALSDLIPNNSEEYEKKRPRSELLKKKGSNVPRTVELTSDEDEEGDDSFLRGVKVGRRLWRSGISGSGDSDEEDSPWLQRKVRCVEASRQNTALTKESAPQVQALSKAGPAATSEEVTTCMDDDTERRR